MDTFAERLDDHTIQFVRLLPGPIEKVWAYLADSDKRGEWFASGTLPANVGESFEMRFKHSTYSPNPSKPPERMIEVDKNGHTSQNILLAFQPPHRLAFTFGSATGGISEVEFRLQQEGDRVRLTLTHSKIPDRKYALDILGGWHSHLDILQDKAEGKVPPGFWDVWRRYEGAYENRYT